MTQRTSRRTVTFARPFRLNGFDAPQPAGSYTVETDEELVDGLSFPVHRRLATLIRLPSPTRGSRVVETVAIDPAELDLALLQDAAPPVAAAEPVAAPSASTAASETGMVPAVPGGSRCR
jgi:hypothetical protein